MESFEWFSSELSRLLDGGLAGAQAENERLGISGLEIHSRAIVGSAKLCWVVDLFRVFYVNPWFLPFIDSYLRWANAVQASLINWLKDGRPRGLLYSLWRTCGGDRWRVPPEEEPSKASIPSYAVVVSALVLLSLVYQYLTGTVDLGSSKAYSSSSLDFRDIYVAIVLFLGAYVWIKFREVALRGVHKRVVKRGGIPKEVYDARLTPPNWNGRALRKLELGQFDTPQEAHNKFLIAAFYYKRNARNASLLDGWFQIPPMSEEERSLTGPEFRTWVIDQAKEVYEDFKKEAATLLHEELSQALGDEEMLEQDEGFVTSTDNSLGFPEESAIPISKLTPDTQSGMGINNSNQLNLPQIVWNQQELITYQQRQLQELGAHNSVLQNQERIHQQQLEEYRTHISQLESQLFVQQQLQFFNQGVPSLEEETEPSMPQQCLPESSLVTLPSGEAEAQEAFI